MNFRPPPVPHGYVYGPSAPPAKPYGKHKKKRRHVHKAGPAKGGGVRSDINVTPLVDVVLVLLIIFMVVTPMLHRGVDLELPKTRHHATRQDTGEQLVVSVRADGVFIEADKVDLDKLPSLLEKELKNNPSRPVNVHADNALKFGEVRKVLEQVHASGAAQVNMETQERKE
jgi:biopolymer transport protein ExbD/biopolymer transport protein TolR